MAVKGFSIFGAVAIFAQSACCVCFTGSPSAVLGLGVGYGYGAGLGSTGIPPVAVSVLSENVYEGNLCVSGNLPFLGTVGIEGVLPTAGVGAVSYGCGDGAIGIGREGPIATGITSPGTYAPGISAIGGLGNGAGLGSLGYGAGLGNGYGGNLPFLGTAGIEGVLPTAGAGAVSYGCGDSCVGIAAEEDPIATGISPSTSFGYGPSGLARFGSYNGYGFRRHGFGNGGFGYGGVY